jgi:tryptophan 2,3-dioxygenase
LLNSPGPFYLLFVRLAASVTWWYFRWSRLADEEGTVVADDHPPMSEYGSYLALNEILAAQAPLSDEHDEMLFIVAHQIHELWFKQLLHEFAHLQRLLAAGDTTHASHTLRRAVAIINVIGSPIYVLDTLTPRQFNRFRDKLGTASGDQSAQFREIEAILGRRDARMLRGLAEGSVERVRVETALSRPSIFDSFVRYLHVNGYPVPADRLHRDFSAPAEPSLALQGVLAQIYQDDDAVTHVCDRLIELDQGMKEWRYRHVSMVERLIGGKAGTGGSSGASYLHTTFTPMFPDLWAVRSQL